MRARNRIALSLGIVLCAIAASIFTTTTTTSTNTTSNNSSFSLFIILSIVWHTGVNWILASLFHHFHIENATHKNALNGRSPILWRLFWLPHELTSCLFVLLFRWYVAPKGMPVVTEVIADQFYLGGFPAFSGYDHHNDAFKYSEMAVIDMTVELSQSHTYAAYLNLPLWDGQAPSLEQLHHATQWAQKQLANGRPILVHCAFGIGRSSTMLVALLLACKRDQFTTWQQCLTFLKSKRSIVRLNDAYKCVLDQYQTQLMNNDNNNKVSR